MEHDGDGIFHYLLLLLVRDGASSTRGLAAELILAMLVDVPKAARGECEMHSGLQVLAHIPGRGLLDIDNLLQLLITDSSLQVRHNI